MPEEQVTPTTDGTPAPETKPEMDFSTYGDDAQTIKEIWGQGPDAILSLLKSKRQATQEAKERRETIEQLKSELEGASKMEENKAIETLKSEYEAKLEAIETEKQTATEAAEALKQQIAQATKTNTLLKYGVKNDYLDHALKLIEIPEKGESDTDEAYADNEKKAIETFREKYPQWFGEQTKARFDKGGAITVNGMTYTLGDIDAKIQEAGSVGNTPEVRRLQELRRQMKSKG